MAPDADQTVPDEAGSDLVGAIEAIRACVTASNPQLYRHLALYLQVLRQTLPVRVERACFHLATRFHSRRYLALDAAERRALHRRIAAHVLRCSSLLTVEQLAVLAAQMARESVRRRRRLQRRLLERLASGADLASPPGLGPAGAGDAASPGDAGGIATVELQQGPDAGTGGFLVPGSLPFSLRLIDDPDQSPAARPFPPEELDAEPEGDEDGPADLADGNTRADRDADADVDAVADALVDAVADAAGQVERPADADGHAADSDESAELLPWPVDGGDPALWQQGLLPGDPLELLRWLDGMELALQRRLRNLSHVINVELLRVGLSPTLLPVSLLDAALMGRVDSAQAPPQLLVLPLPFSGPGLADAPRAMALLLRRTDLELEEPRLRTCRRRLQQHRQQLRRMADRFRRLQRRLDIHQAERLWLQDLPTAAPGVD